MASEFQGFSLKSQNFYLDCSEKIKNKFVLSDSCFSNPKEVSNPAISGDPCFSTCPLGEILYNIHILCPNIIDVNYVTLFLQFSKNG